MKKIHKVYVVTSTNCRTGKTSISGVFSDEDRAKEKAADVSMDTNMYNEDFSGDYEEFILDSCD